MSELQVYVIRAQHPSNGLDLDVELIASSERYAISRTRGTLFHRDRDVEWLAGTFTVLSVSPRLCRHGYDPAESPCGSHPDGQRDPGA